MTRFLMSVVLLAGVFLIACSGGGQQTPTVVPTPTETSTTASPSPDQGDVKSGEWCTPVLAEGETPTPTPDVSRRLSPPYLVLVAGECEQQAYFGAYFWQHEAGAVAEISVPGHQIHDGSLKLSEGQEVHFDVRVGPVPEALTLQAYPREGNVRPMEELPNEQGTPMVGTPVPGSEVVDSFKPTTDPAATTEISVDQLTWQVDLPAGEYFLLLSGEWPNPDPEGQTMHANYAFTIVVE